MNVYITPFEHNAVTRVLHHISKKYEITIYQLYIEPDNICYDLEKIAYQFQDHQPDLVVASHGSNVCGVIAPIKEIFDLAKAYNAITVTDTAQTAGLVEIDLSVIDSDFTVFAGHKTLYGPFGVGGFLMKDSTSLVPLLYGGTGVDSANQELPIALPERFEVGSPNVAAIAGLNAALQWLEENSINEIRIQEEKHKEKLLQILKGYDNIRVFEPLGANIGVVSCVFEGYGSDSVGKVLDQHGIAVRTGLHCSPTAHHTLKTFPGGTVRFSISYFTTDEDFEQLKEALDYIEENS